MKSIEKIKSAYIESFAKQYYGVNSSSDLDSEKYHVCSSIAEVWAYIYIVLPEGHGDYSIFDFVGDIFDKKTNEKKTVVSPDKVIKAKNEICKYCWGVEWEIIKEKRERLSEKEMAKYLRVNSVVEKRMKQGRNVVIYGASTQPIGRTMVASIIMKEVIKLRATRGTRNHTYDWIDFNTLLNATRKDEFELADYRSCDFLVVDNIIDYYRTLKQQTYIIDNIDSFFIERFSDKLPTVLVFKFNIDGGAVDIEQLFGVGINRIVNSKRTDRISLS